MKTVMCFGTFDLLHLGHIHYFKQAKKYGDYLLVVIARDSTKEQQQKEAIFTEKERQELISQLRLVDEVVLGDPQDHLKIIEEKKPDVICLGYDHPIKEEELAKELQKKNLFPIIQRMKPYRIKRHKGSRLRSLLFDNF
ncbi:adenylyltransferase/cytidyltransferase family protein [Candidatus Woesearchaeota archaeon]|nr:adenylyltransferase/cytidyltransferase family protein [Candidatus Woesearchaeota archaeon]